MSHNLLCKLGGVNACLLACGANVHIVQELGSVHNFSHLLQAVD
jgi:hypothetical protein